MPRHSRSPSPDESYKRRKQSYPSRDSPSPTRRNHQQSKGPSGRDRREKYDDERRRGGDKWNRDRDLDRPRYSDRDGRDRDSRDTRRRRSRSRSRDRYQRSPRDSDRGRPRDSHTRSPERVSTITKSNDPPPPPPAATVPPPVEDEKMKAKRERLEAWKKDREAKKALEEAKAKAQALALAKSAGAGGAGVTPSIKLPASANLPAKPTTQLNRTALTSLGLKGLPVKPEIKSGKATAAMDDFAESGRKLVKLGDMPPVDLSVSDANIGSVGENLEADDDDDDAAVRDVTMADPDDDEDEVDPLDAFMTGVKAEVKKVNEEDKMRFGISVEADGPEDVEEDGIPQADEIDATNLRPEDILALAAKKVKKKDLGTIDHSKVTYDPFRSNFYRVPPDIENMTDQDVDDLRLTYDGIKIRGVECPRPITKWSHCGLPTVCLDVIKRLNYDSPTSIQSQAIPAIMSGRDVIGVAKTGSGKTIAFLLPLFRHIKDQRPLEQMEGPMAIVMTPTRELATQIHRECKPFLKVLNLRAVCAYGGSPIKDQIAEMKKGAEIVVCTPGRMIDLLTANSGRVTNLKRVTYLVLDEADRMFDMGFEPQVMKIINNIRPDRQTVLFSATFPKQMDSLARKILRRPLEITVGGRSVVAAEIEQIVEIRPEESKFNRLLEILGQTYNDDRDARTLIFVDRQEAADNLYQMLREKGYVSMSLHGGKDQVDRDATIADFKAGVIPMVIATSVAARGLDVKQLKLVINFDAPNHMEDYVHRAGRTGRAGNKGTCVTFVTPEQERYSVDIYRALEASKANIPTELKEMHDNFLEKVKSGKAQSYAGSGFGGKGLDRLDKERDAKEKAQRTAYGEVDEKPAATTEDGSGGAENKTSTEKELPFEFKVEIKRGPAPPDTSKMSAAARNASDGDGGSKGGASGLKQALSIAAKLNAQVKAAKANLQNQQTVDDGTGRKPKDPDATDFHAIIPINDYPQKARWRVTNKETMVQLVDMTGASVTNKGIYYEQGKEPGPDQPPKLHLLIESNDEFRVEQAVREIKRLLIEASTAALQAESRNPTGTAGRYTVI